MKAKLTDTAIAKIADLVAENATLKQQVADLTQALASAQKRKAETVTETPSYASSLNDARPFIPASAGGVKQPWESLWRKVQASMSPDGCAPRNSGLPNKTSPAGHRDLSFPYSIRERVAMERIREVSATLMGDIAREVQSAFDESGESATVSATRGLPAYVPKSTWGMK